MEGTPLNDRKAKDETLVTNIMDQLNRGDIDVKFISRLGKLDQQSTKRLTRPIKLSFRMKECWYSVFRNASRLADTTDPQLIDIYLGYDLSQNKRRIV